MLSRILSKIPPYYLFLLCLTLFYSLGFLNTLFAIQDRAPIYDVAIVCYSIFVAVVCIEARDIIITKE